MITGEKLLALLDNADKTDRDLIMYVCNGLQAYDVNQRPVYPARLLLVTWQKEAARVAETHLLFEEEAARLDVSARDLMTEHLAHRRVMQDMKAEDAERYRLSIPSEVLKELLSRDVTIKQLIENLPDGENRRMAQRRVEAASVFEMLSRENFESVHSRLNALIELVSGGEPIPLQWLLGVFTNTAIDGLAAEMMQCYYDRQDVQRFLDADAQDPPVSSESKATEELARPGQTAITINGTGWCVGRKAICEHLDVSWSTVLRRKYPLLKEDGSNRPMQSKQALDAHRKARSKKKEK